MHLRFALWRGKVASLDLGEGVVAMRFLSLAASLQSRRIFVAGSWIHA